MYNVVPFCVIGVVTAVTTMAIFIIFGRALLQAIDKSLQNQKHQHKEAPGTLGGGQSAHGGRGALQHAKRKIKTVVAVEVFLVSTGCSITLVAVITGFDTELPLVMFGIPFVYVPLGWLAFNVQVHSGRSRSRERLPLPINSRPLSPGSRSRPGAPRSNVLPSRKQEQRVVPTSAPC